MSKHPLCPALGPGWAICWLLEGHEEDHHDPINWVFWENVGEAIELVIEEFVTPRCMDSSLSRLPLHRNVQRILKVKYSFVYYRPDMKGIIMSPHGAELSFQETKR